MIRSYLINIIFAALVGAGTNELAIWLILHRILPRKKKEFARRVRDIISTDLMSPDKMREKLDEPQVGDVLRKTIDKELADLLSRDLSAPAELLGQHMPELDAHALSALVRDSLLGEFSARCDNPAFSAGVIRPFLAERWDAMKHRSPKSLLSVQMDSLSAFARDWVVSLERSESLKRNIRRFLDGWLADRIGSADSLADLLSPGMVAALEDLAVSQTPVVIRQLADSLRDPGIRDAIAAAVMAGIDKQLRGQGVLGDIKSVVAGAMRIERDVDGICRKLPAELQEHFHQPGNREAFANALRKAVRNCLEHPLSGDFKSPAMREAAIAMLLERVWRSGTFAELGRRARSVLDEALSRSFNESIWKLGIAASRDAVLDEAAARCRRILASDATRDLLAKQFDELVEAWKKKPLGRLDRFVGAGTRSRISAVAADEAWRMLRLRLGDFAQEAGVWDIVTESIEGYSDKEISGMIINLARVELRWVTVVGGVIGAIVGLLQRVGQSYGWW